MFTPSSKNASVKIPLCVVLIVPFVVLVVATVGLVSYLSFSNGQRAVNDVARQLCGETGARIIDHLRAFLDTPPDVRTHL
ncbi:MAG: hypothetical protein FJ009_21515 [Chloroflexi bacterium]|nr:hypothetical protein [Chloroflexota bacterium]